MEEQEKEVPKQVTCQETIRDTVEALVREGYAPEDAIIAIAKDRYYTGMDSD